MDLQIAVICDAATDNAGKLNILGTFDTIFVAQTPAKHPQCAVALRMSFSKVEEGAHKVRMSFMDEDGKTVMPVMEIPLDVRVPEDAIFVSRNILVNIHQLTLPKAGLYSVDIGLDGRQVGSIPLLVKTMQQPQPKPEDPGF